MFVNLILFNGRGADILKVLLQERAEYLQDHQWFSPVWPRTFLQTLHGSQPATQITTKIIQSGFFCFCFFTKHQFLKEFSNHGCDDKNICFGASGMFYHQFHEGRCFHVEADKINDLLKC